MYRIFHYSTSWSTDRLTQKVEEKLGELEAAGWEIVSVSFGTNLWYQPTAFVTVRQARIPELAAGEEFV